VVAATAAVLCRPAPELTGHHQQHIVAEARSLDGFEECIDTRCQVLQQAGLFGQLVGVCVEASSADHDHLRARVCCQ